ncbi:MAG: glutamate racemase [Acidobacteria bacterium RIFCSPLOWO2_02_FULL_68_18]|nr:MAG: glutamate racemase [Acidobacteria bacterium RIFCSPLOWO2_02_FULL_68_18]OFW48407.1 MAG: glutamate racemase [Acidobacteria bacterium RIFCSPLOWO2_12_FULL_68_19]
MVLEQPIGVFDSGVGGLSVLREIRRELPAEDLLYVADSAFAPYGGKPPAVIRARAAAIVRWLDGRGVKLVVVACNTATGVAIDALRAETETPIVAIEPAVKPAALDTRTGVIGVLATAPTLASARFERLVSSYGANVDVLQEPCPGLVEQVEKGDLAGAETRSLVERYVRPLVERGADILVLGCTHYPFLKDAIQAAAGSSVRVIDPAVAVAREVGRRLAALNRLAPPERQGAERFWTSGTPADVRPVIVQLWQREVDVGRLVAD